MISFGRYFDGGGRDLEAFMTNWGSYLERVLKVLQKILYTVYIDVYYIVWY